MLPGNVLLIPAAVDPADPFARLLLHMDGTDGATTFPDSSPSARTVTVNGNAQVDTAQSVFGGASALFDGTGDFLTVPEAADFDIATGDFVIDFRWRTSSLGGFQLQEILSKRANSGAFAPIEISCQPVGDTLQVYASSNGASWNILSAAWNAAVAVNTWYHVAVIRSGNSIYAAKDGIVALLTSGGGTLLNNSSAWNIGGVSGGPGFVGWMDELRISIGTDRGWTTNFTPPASAYTG